MAGGSFLFEPGCRSPACPLLIDIHPEGMSRRNAWNVLRNFAKGRALHAPTKGAARRLPAAARSNQKPRRVQATGFCLKI